MTVVASSSESLLTRRIDVEISWMAVVSSSVDEANSSPEATMLSVPFLTSLIATLVSAAPFETCAVLAVTCSREAATSLRDEAISSLESVRETACLAVLCNESASFSTSRLASPIDVRSARATESARLGLR